MAAPPLIAGAAMTAFARRPDTTLGAMCEPVVADALAQANAPPATSSRSSAATRWPVW